MTQRRTTPGSTGLGTATPRTGGSYVVDGLAFGGGLGFEALFARTCLLLASRNRGDELPVGDDEGVAHAAAGEVVGDLHDQGLGGSLARGDLEFSQARPVVERLVALEGVEGVGLPVGDGGEHALAEHFGRIFGGGLGVDEERGRVLAEFAAARAAERRLRSPPVMVRRTPQPLGLGLLFEGRDRRCVPHGIGKGGGAEVLGEREVARAVGESLQVLVEVHDAGVLAVAHGEEGLSRPTPCCRPASKAPTMAWSGVRKDPVEEDGGHGVVGSALVGGGRATLRRHGVVPAGHEGIAPENTADGEPRPAAGPRLAERVDAVVRAGGMEATLPAHEGARRST
jgi:hypothetical protein